MLIQIEIKVLKYQPNPILLTPLRITHSNPLTYPPMINNESKFAITIDVSKFKPENLKVNIDGRQLTIEGKEDHCITRSGTLKSDLSFVRRWMLPENVDLEAIRSSLSNNGRLAIEAPKLAKAADSGRSIPIERVSEKQ
ncbi:unnamed protein product [Haemonchus placei]|uniref:SHSP domain-containing protein n=1 Tax=Haemonchus placei TaxID=6290 RepID=A0A0N4W203_HAEPC|nr:unnamed protein product [Haemonchus placei]